MTRWGKDQEERSAVAQKAQDAYASARQAMSKAEGAEASAGAVAAEIADLRALVARLSADLSLARRDIATLRRQFDEATEVEPIMAPAPVMVPTTPAKRKRAA